MIQTLISLFLMFSCTNQQKSNIKQQPVKIKQEAENRKFDSIITNRCFHNDLSFEFDYEINSERFVYSDGENDSCVVSVSIFDKTSHKKIESLSLSSIFYFGDVFGDCNKTRSFLTGKNTNLEVADNYFGEFIIVDINFDTKEDVVVINDSGGNGGTLYSFYIQDEHKKFHLDTFLTDSVIYFPTKINEQNQTIVTLVHAGANGLGEHVYSYNTLTKSWKEKSHKYIDCSKN